MSSTMKSYNGFSGAQRRAALRWVKARKRDGTYTHAKPTRCDACGQTKGAIVRHSEDYSQPFGPHIGAHALCFFCHMMIHVRHRPECSARWRHYRDRIRMGFESVPTAQSEFGHVWRYATGIAELRMARRRDPQRETLLDRIDRGDPDLKASVAGVQHRLAFG